MLSKGNKEMHKALAMSMALNRLSHYERARFFQILCWLDVHPSEHRLVFRDIQDAFGWVGIFPPEAPPDSEAAGKWRRELWDTSKLVDNNWKAAQPAYAKDWRSLYTIPAEF